MANALRLSRTLLSVRSALSVAPRSARFIQTTPKKQDGSGSVARDDAPVTAEQFRDVAKQKNWVSWGFDTKDREYDTNTLHATMFFTITLCIVIGGFWYGYAPDFLLRDWSQREAFLELRRREAAGLDPISRDYVEEGKMELPSDEELGATEIII